MQPVSPVLPSAPESAREREIVLAKDQPEYIPLPALVYRSIGGTRMTTRWKLSLPERLKLLFSGNLYFQQLTFNQPFQPILPTVDEPIAHEIAEHVDSPRLEGAVIA